MHVRITMGTGLLGGFASRFSTVLTALAVTVILVGAMAGCSGSTGAQGPAGTTGAIGPTGPTGPTGPITALDISTATAITATINSVTVPAAPAPARPVVKFTLVDQIGQPLKGLPAADLGVVIAKLVPPATQLKAVPPQTTAPTPQISAQWQSYIYHSASPAPASAGTTADPVVGATAQPQATTEAGTSGTLVDNGDGTYQYTFNKDISADAAVTYDATLVHRVGFEIRGEAPANSPVYTFQPSSGATTGLMTNAIVDDTTCLNCHQQLAFHGGARTTVQYCVMCHNPSSVDPSSGNSIDFKIMFHKIHMGVHLPSVQGTGLATKTNYYIYGFRNSINDYSNIVFPTDAANGPDTCNTCHKESDPATPDTVHWRDTPSIEACGSCHDNVNFTTGANHSAAQLGNLTDNDCATCHGPNATASVAVGNTQVPIQVASAHANLVEYNKVLNYSQQFAYNIQSVSLASAAPTVIFSVTDPTTPGHIWNILTDAPFTGSNCPTAGIGISLAWSTTDYTNTGSSVASEAQPYRTSVTCNSALVPMQNADGSFTVALPAAATVSGGLLAAGILGSAGVLIDGFPAHDFDDGQGPQELVVPSVVAAGAITDPSPMARRNVVDVAKCDKCHNVLNAHGNHRVDNVQACAVCHNPNATDIAARAAAGVTAANAPDGATEQPIDLKYMIHALHDGNVRAAVGAPYVVYHRGSFTDFRAITPFPGALNNCLGCHLSGTFYPQDPTTSTSLATTINSNNNSASPAGQVAMTPATSVCSACHVSSIEHEHMMQNGGSFTALKLANSQLAAGNSETCVLCHGQGAIADVAVVHNLSLYH